MDIAAVGSLVIPLIVAALVAWRLWRIPSDGYQLSSADRGGVAIIGGLATAIGSIALLWPVAMFFGGAVGPVTVPNMPLGTSVKNDAVLGLSGVIDASTSTVDVTLSNAPAAVGIGMFLHSALPVALLITVCIVTVLLARGVLRGRPFRRSFTASLTTLAIAVAVFGLGSNVALVVAQVNAAEFLNNTSVTGGTAVLPVSWTIDFTPLGIALFIALLAAASHLGQKMQNDTEALV